MRTNDTNGELEGNASAHFTQRSLDKNALFHSVNLDEPKKRKWCYLHHDEEQEGIIVPTGPGPVLKPNILR